MGDEVEPAEKKCFEWGPSAARAFDMLYVIVAVGRVQQQRTGLLKYESLSRSARGNKAYLQVVIDLGPDLHGFLEGGSTDGQDHELLHRSSIR